MTIPVIPGPFSFIERLGESLDRVSADVIAAQERRRRRFLEDQALAQQDAEIVLRIADASGNPAVLNAPGVQESLRRAGVDTGILDVILSPQAQLGQTLPGVAPERREAFFGIPSTTRVGRERSEDVSATLRADITADALRAAPEGGAARRAVAGVQAEPVAAAGEAAQIAGAEAATAKAAAEKRTQELVSKHLSDPQSDFGFWASVAEAGFLPLYLTRIQSSVQLGIGQREEQKRRFDLLVGPIEDARRQFRELTDAYKAKRAQQVQLFGEDPKKVAAWDAENPAPDITQIMNKVLIDAAVRLFPGSDKPVEEYFKELRDAAGLIRGSIPAARSTALDAVAKDIAEGKLQQAAAEREIARLSDDPAFEIAELRRRVQVLRGRE